MQMPLLTEDRSLLAAFREGKREALERVYRHYVNDVARFLQAGFSFQAGGTPRWFPGFRAPFELESLVQDVFLRAFSDSARASYDGLRPYRSFLQGVARNVALRELERRAGEGARYEPLDEAGPGVSSLPATGTDEELERAEERALVQEFLTGACDDRDRRLFELRFDEGLSQEAAAQAAGMTRIVVRRWETKFRARLLRHLLRAGYVRREP